MGISTVQSLPRRAALRVRRASAPTSSPATSPGTVSRVGGIGARADRGGRRARTRAACTRPAGGELDPGGEYRLPPARRAPRLEPRDRSSTLQRAVRDELPDSYRAFAEAARRGRTGSAAPCAACSSSCRRPAAAARRGRALGRDRAAGSPPGAMSLGSISPEAHETLAIAHEPARRPLEHRRGRRGPARARCPTRTATLRRSAIKQVASARFGVTAAYLVDADELQIKVAQGAKPGEGGQLPGHKVDARDRAPAPLDARRRADLAAAAPRHLLDRGPGAADPRPAAASTRRPRSRSSSSPRRASARSPPASPRRGADHIVIAGHDGGTGASPLSSIKHAGAALGARARRDAAGARRQRPARPRAAAGRRRPAHRPRRARSARCSAPRSSRFSTAPLVAAGCVMMRVCHLNTCPVGIATQDPELRRRFAGTPEHVVQYFLFVAEEVRELHGRSWACGASTTSSAAPTCCGQVSGDRGAGLDLARAARHAPPGPTGAARVARLPDDAPRRAARSRAARRWPATRSRAASR